MSTITTRSGKGSALTFTEVDNNFTNLNTDKIQNIVEDTTPQLGGNLDVNGNSIVSTSNGDINLTPDGTGKVVTTKTLNANILASTQSSGDEGGQLELALASTNNSLSGSVAIDINQNKLRIFETGGSNRGAYIDLSTASTGVGSDLLAGGASSLSSLSDVSFGTLASGEVLQYNGTSWTDVATSTLTVGTATNSTNATNATNIVQTVNSTSATYYPLLSTTSTTGTRGSVFPTSITMNPSTGAITTTGPISAEAFVEPTIFSLTYATPLAPNVANGSIQKVTLSGNLTINGFTSPVTGQTLTLLVYGGVGYTTVTSTMLFAGGNKTLSGTTGCLDIITITYTDGVYLASIARGFA